MIPAGSVPTSPPLFKRALTKPDGRRMVLYSREAIAESIRAPSPHDGPPIVPSPHLRWHPLRGEWVVYAGYRQARTFLPPADYDPLMPSADPARPTELPAGDYDVATFENLFPAFFGGAGAPPTEIVATLPAQGVCEVVVYARDPHTSLGALPLWHVELVIEVWGDRTRELGARSDVAYVFPFENRGVEVGVTLHHPHGQIYAYPFVPPIAERELEMQRAYHARTGRGLLDDHLRDEIRDGRRILHLGPCAVAIVPVCARYAYEVWVAPRRPVATAADLDANERRELAYALKRVLLSLDGLWSKPMPYVMVLHQAPTDGRPHPEAHFHIEIYPAYRMPTRLKYLAGSEIGAGTFTADTLPEQTAAELRAVRVSP